MGDDNEVCCASNCRRIANPAERGEVFHDRSGYLQHGFYYGSKQLPGVDMVVNFQMPAVDAVDQAGRKHDAAYEAVGATARNASGSWATIEADKEFIQANALVMQIGVGGEDPYNGQKITSTEYTYAKLGKDYFTISAFDKMEAVSDWMQKNYPSMSQEPMLRNGNDVIKSNYEKFRDTYMHFDEKDDVWKTNDGMWKETGSKGTIVPKTKAELDKK